MARLPDKAIKNSFPKETNSEYALLYLGMCSEEHEKNSDEFTFTELYI